MVGSNADEMIWNGLVVGEGDESKSEKVDPGVRCNGAALLWL